MDLTFGAHAMTFFETVNGDEETRALMLDRILEVALTRPVAQPQLASRLDRADCAALGASFLLHMWSRIRWPDPLLPP